MSLKLLKAPSAIGTLISFSFRSRSKSSRLGWPQSPEPPPAHKVWHWTDWRVSLQHWTADHILHTCPTPRQHLAIAHKLVEETVYGSLGNLRATAASSERLDWTSEPGRTTKKKDSISEASLGTLKPLLKSCFGRKSSHFSLKL